MWAANTAQEAFLIESIAGTRGFIDGYGTVNFKIGADAAGNIQITKTSETGTGRGDTTWKRCEPGFPA